MLTIMRQGGPLMWLILLNGIIAVGIYLEKWFHFHRAHINTTDFLAGIRNALKRGNVIESIALCDETPGPVAEVVKAGITNRDRPREEIREAMEDAARVEIARLERRLVVLATIAQITPLLGFLGTVFGMITMFRVIQLQQLPSPGQLAGGVWEALLTTAGGLVVAVPTYVCYNYLVSRVQNIVLDMERAANEMIRFLTRPDNDTAGQ
ncbi:MAG: MotA/TolQ/ExbB proton channel family protein [Verrucomicrobiota bacterium]